MIDNGPGRIAHALGWAKPGGAYLHWSWDGLLDQAALRYWQNRPEPSAAALTEHRRRRLRERTSPAVWLRRAGEAA